MAAEQLALQQMEASSPDNSPAPGNGGNGTRAVLGAGLKSGPACALTLELHGLLLEVLNIRTAAAPGAAVGGTTTRSVRPSARRTSIACPADAPGGTAI